MPACCLPPSSPISALFASSLPARAVKAALIPGKTKLVMLESPTNPRMQICDIKAICEVGGWARLVPMWTGLGCAGRQAGACLTNLRKMMAMSC